MDREAEVTTFVRRVANLRNRRSGWLALALLGVGALGAGAICHGGWALQITCTFVFTGGPVLLFHVVMDGRSPFRGHRSRPRVSVKIEHASYRGGSWTAHIDTPTGKTVLNDEEIIQALCFYDDGDGLFEPNLPDELLLIISAGDHTVSLGLPVTDEVTNELFPVLRHRLRYVRIA